MPAVVSCVQTLRADKESTSLISGEDTLDTTRSLSKALAEPVSRMTSYALVRGESIVRGVDFEKNGWFLVHRLTDPIEKQAQMNPVKRQKKARWRAVTGTLVGRGQ